MILSNTNKPPGLIPGRKLKECGNDASYKPKEKRGTWQTQ